MARLSSNFPLELARKAGLVIVLPIGVYFPIADPGQANRRVGCFCTLKAIAQLLKKDQPSADEVRSVFHDHRPAIERLATALYHSPAYWV
jgi:Protein of unknown function (DUF1488)